MPPNRPGDALLGRRNECKELDRLLEAVGNGRGGVLVLRGEPGVGKTALLDYAAESASGFRIARAAGVESEMELAFAGVQQLCAPMLDRLERLPGPQRDPLAVAFGLSAGEPPDRFLVGLAILNLLSEVAQEQPLLCVLDDAQWLDRASRHVLSFVARRLLAEPLALLFATRELSDELRELPDLEVKGLPAADARALLTSVLRVPVDEPVLERFLAETRGNPLALLELPKALTPAQLAGGFVTPGAGSLSGQIEEGFQRRLATLPAETRRLLLVAAAEPLGEPVLLWRAAERLGIDLTAADAAESAGLLTIDSRVIFRHPLVRSAAYRAASPYERREAHRALAEATDPEVDPDRRAWHRAQAASQPDEDVASELERSAGRAHARGGFAAAAAFLERAVALTLDPGRRAERALAAAHAKHEAGAPEAASALLAVAEAGPLDDYQAARVELLRAQIVFASSRGSDAPPLLLHAAKRLEPLDPALARRTYLEAFTAGIFAGRLASAGGIRETAEAVRAAAPARSPGRPQPALDLLVDGWTAAITESYRTGAPLLKRALTTVRDAEISTEEAMSWLWLGVYTATYLWDDEAWHELAERQVAVARRAGAVSLLPIALDARAASHLFSGELTEAAALIEEANALARATGRGVVLHSALLLAAWRGRSAETSELIDVTMRDAVSRGGGIGLPSIHAATAMLHNGLGQYGDALRAAERAVEYSYDGYWSLAELIEAAARSGQPERARHALAWLSEMTTASGTDWGLGIAARSEALMTDGADAEDLYLEAIERLGRTSIRIELARAHLLYGEWLRRQRRRMDAREQLRTAHELFTSIGIDAFAQRARVELEATGGRARKRSVEAPDELTPQEAQISRLVADGATNQEIAAQLFISPSTVDYHLRKTFRKLGVKSRTQLARHMLRGNPHTPSLSGTRVGDDQ